jgi:hypothetical protein
MNVMKTRIGDPDGLLEKLEIETSPWQIGDTQASNSVKNTDNLDESRRLRGIVMRRTVPLRLNLRSPISLLLGWHTVNPFHVSLRLAEMETIRILLV